jgi:hypothetical protein
MTTPTFARVEARLWSDGATNFRSCQRFAATEGASSSDRVLASSATFSDALDTIVAGLNADLPGTYAWALSAAGVLTLSSSATFTITWHYGAQAAFGFTGTQSGASSYSSTLPVLLACPALVLQVEPPSDSSFVELVTASNGRSFATQFATLERWAIVVRVREAAADALRVGYCSRGRVRVYLGADSSPASATNLDGYVDGYLHGCVESSPDEFDGWVDFTLQIARATA